MLLPLFEQQLSAGFYTYIFYFSWVIFFALAVLIVVQFRKELDILRSLMGGFAEWYILEVRCATMNNEESSKLDKLFQSSKLWKS